MRNDFCIFILSHGRPDNVKTIGFLDRLQSEYPRYILCDNEDKTLERYYELYGNTVFTFNKEFTARHVDTMDMTENRKCVVFARHAVYKVAEELGYDYFLVLDDDTTNLRFNNPDGKFKVKYLDPIIDAFVEFVENTNVLTIAFCQGGDAFRSKRGNADDFRYWKRKAMNSFFCATKRPIDFLGSINEDTNAYALYGMRGDIFLTMYNVLLDQVTTQSSDGGLTDIYKQYGTYRKSFYTVMLVPSACKVNYMRSNHPRMHHIIKYNNLAPMIISDKYKKL